MKLYKSKIVQHTILFIGLLLVSSLSYGQVGIGTNSPHGSAELEISSADKGLLIPRLSRHTDVSNPAAGLLVYDISYDKFYFYTGSRWQQLNPIYYSKGDGTEDDMVMSPSTNIGISASSPASKLSVNGNAAIGTTYADNYAAPANGMIIEGNVGIGTNNPGTNKLEVNGNLSVTSGAISGYGTVPIGGIIMWSGNPAVLPDGWELCDGGSGRPDLRGRFIAGYDPADTDYDAIGDVGGNATHDHSVDSHSHDIDHDHTAFNVTINGGDWENDDKAGALANFEPSTNDEYLQFDADVTKSIDVPNYNGTSGNSSPDTNLVDGRPPYYTLAYIIRVL
jgi:hypothetical protein